MLRRNGTLASKRTASGGLSGPVPRNTRAMIRAARRPATLASQRVWPLAAPLDLAQVIDGVVSLPQRFEKNVGCRHGILDREIDADAADRRHGVGGVANAQETRPKPIDQSVHTNR